MSSLASDSAVKSLDTLLRLQGLKNVSPRRRVMPEQEIDRSMEPPDVDMQGIAQKIEPLSGRYYHGSPQSSEPNIPQIDTGLDTNSQSYDVRANSNTSAEQDPGLLKKLGSSIGNFFKESFTPNLASDFGRHFPDAANKIQNNKQKTQEPSPVPLEPLGSKYYHAGIQTVPQQSGWDKFVSATSTTPEKNRQTIERAQQQKSGIDLVEKQQQLNAQHDENAEKVPWQFSAYGSAQQVANHPALQAEFKNITGVDYNPQIAAQVTKFEEAMEGVEDALRGENKLLSEESEKIKQRILNNQATDSDKYYIALALMMPLLIGGVFGKEAGLGALGGGAQGIADVLGGREKTNRQDEASLLDLAKQKSGNLERLANIGLERSKFEPSLRKSLPDDPRSHLMGMREVQWQNPETGEVEGGVELLPGFVAKSQYVGTNDNLKDMKKSAQELAETKNFVDETSDLTEDIINVVSQLEDNGWISQAIKGGLLKVDPTYLSRISQDVNVGGVNVNAGVYLREKLGFLANAYAQAKRLGQLDRAAQSHLDRIFNNPESSLTTNRDSIRQMLEVRKLTQNGLLYGAINKGFVPEFIIESIESKNNPLFSGLNRQEQDKREKEIYDSLLKGV